ncbi:hypothetical protein ANN_20373 [Periplaneta americana]|uniref:Uncharacterized protein n=1 Tax=Periplaneta americana TaxID=6978 RepID=A0ABQ8SCX2_PERAM|nr:hypothetical protein ANN_20373 [Periplaneta americana]
MDALMAYDTFQTFGKRCQQRTNGAETRSHRHNVQSICRGAVPRYGVFNGLDGRECIAREHSLIPKAEMGLSRAGALHEQIQVRRRIPQDMVDECERTEFVVERERRKRSSTMYDTVHCVANRSDAALFNACPITHIIRWTALVTADNQTRARGPL